MMWIPPLQQMTSLQSGEEGMPLMYKSLPNLSPQMLNAGIKHQRTPHEAGMVEPMQQDHKN